MVTSLARRSSPPLAYASVGQSGDFSAAPRTDDPNTAQTWTFCCGAGWLYGLGLCIGPFYGTGVGFTLPGGVLAGAGGGVGVVVGIGMGGGLVWGSGRGVVRGFGVIPPMKPPFADMKFPKDLSELPTPKEIAQRVGEEIEETRARIRDRFRYRRSPRKLAFATPPSNRRQLVGGGRVAAGVGADGGFARPNAVGLGVKAAPLLDPRWRSPRALR